MIRLDQATVALVLLTSMSRGFPSDHVLYVHMVDARTGSSVPGKTIEIAWDGRKSGRLLKERTGRDGIAAFHFDDPMPSKVELRPGGGYWDSYSPNSYDTQEVLEAGVSAEQDYWSLKLPNLSDKFHPKPGEIYFFVCHVPFGKWLKEWFKSLK